MAEKLAAQDGMTALRRSAPDWLPIAAGFVLLLVPTLYRLLSPTGAWMGEEQAHGPIILALSLWLMWRNLPTMMAQPVQPSRAGWGLLGLGLLMYILGRSQQILSFEILSLQFVAIALVLLQRGTPSLRVQWFPFFFMLFLVPLPGPIVSMLTMPMKMAVSYVTEHILYAAGLPIARSGVILQIGQYQLLVADACAGLQTLLTLEALGLFYLNVVRHTSAFRNLALAVLIVPISFTANVIRVIVLTLVTFYLGDAAGQGFLHGFAGMVLFVTALILILSMDSLLQWVVRRRERRGVHA
ncbi:exosortase B [Pseudoduganella chitinolytica]|uniref:Exosortase B n=1 Tax=Pseudoduganella chitinolytica TaxID=34070 RepID=A0ABY8BN13_9BURK|nr:exosortase B [Pseudoduganella chitinolytica]WEF35679.1 exosortase B [Pseudoduganella chitinolytica]